MALNMHSKSMVTFTAIQRKDQKQWWVAMIEPDKIETFCSFEKIAQALGVDSGWLMTSMIRNHDAEINSIGGVGWTSKRGAEKGVVVLEELYLANVLAFDMLP